MLSRQDTDPISIEDVETLQIVAGRSHPSVPFTPVEIKFPVRPFLQYRQRIKGPVGPATRAHRERQMKLSS